MSKQTRRHRASQSSMGPFMVGAVLAGGLGVAGLGLGAFSLGNVLDHVHDKAAVSASESPGSESPGSEETPSTSPAPTTPAPPSGADDDYESPGDSSDSSDPKGSDDTKRPYDTSSDGSGGKDHEVDAEGIVYIPRRLVWGDTLWDISQETGVSVERLAEYNDIPNPDLIYAGDILRVPEE